MLNRGFEEKFKGDPLKELEANTKKGNYRFRGVTDFDVTPSRSWVPGVPEDQVPFNHAYYQGLGKKATWAAAAIRYYTIYNRALLIKRRDKTLNGFGCEGDHSPLDRDQL